MMRKLLVLYEWNIWYLFRGNTQFTIQIHCIPNISIQISKFLKLVYILPKSGKFSIQMIFLIINAFSIYPFLLWLYWHIQHFDSDGILSNFYSHIEPWYKIGSCIQVYPHPKSLIANPLLVEKTSDPLKIQNTEVHLKTT